jgi:hypothetical protein
MRTLRSFGILVSLFLLFSACGQRESPSGSQPKSEGAASPTKPAAVATPPAPAGPILTDFKCELAVKNVPSKMRPGSGDTRILVQVTNKSSAKWPALLPGRSVIHSVNIAYRWWQGKDMVSEGNRVMFPADLGPGESVTVELPVVAPTTPGTYTLRVEPVQEAVAWFGDAGGCKFESNVRVEP